MEQMLQLRAEGRAGEERGGKEREEGEKEGGNNVVRIWAFQKTPLILCEYVFFFCFIPRCGIWGCFRLPTAADYDLSCALVGV